MAKAKELSNAKPGLRQIIFECPGCGMWHCCAIKSPTNFKRPSWDFNNDFDRPTFSPSILVRYPLDGIENVCHSFVENGEIRFLGDCTHHLSGKTVELPDL